jgi:hypothetical protein
MNGSGYSTTTSQLSVRRVDDGIHIWLACDISSNTFNRNAGNCSLHDENVPLVLPKLPPSIFFQTLSLMTKKVPDTNSDTNSTVPRDHFPSSLKTGPKKPHKLRGKPFSDGTLSTILNDFCG